MYEAVFWASWRYFSRAKSCNRIRNRAGDLTQAGLDEFGTSQDSLRRDWEPGKREIGGVYLSRWGSASLHPLPPPPCVFWGRELGLRNIAAPHSGRAPNKCVWGGGHRRSVEETGEGRLKRRAPLKKGCQNNENKWLRSLLRWRGELHLRGVFAGVLLPRHSNSWV